MIKKIQNITHRKPCLTAAVLGAFYTLGFAPFSIWIVGLLSLSGLVFLCKNQNSAKQSFTIGFAFGLVHYVTSLHWMVGSFYVTIGNLPLAIAVGGLCVLLISACLALYIGFVGCAVQKIRHSMLFPVIFAVVWVFAEYIRGSLTPTFAWNLVGYQWAYADEILQLASVGGIYLLSFIFVLLAGLLASSFKGRILALLVFIACYGFGYERLSEYAMPDVTTSVEGKTYVRLISGNVNQFDKWKPEKRHEFIDKYINQSNTGDKVPDIVIWPETAMTSALNRASHLRSRLASSVNAKHIITGAPYKSGQNLYYNSIYLLDDKGDVQSHYDKRHLVPFGEYFPFREYFPTFFESFLQGQGEYTAGENIQDIFSVEGLSFAPLVCGEVVLPSIKTLIPENTDYILNISNDAWFKGLIGPYQHFAFVKVRAATLNKPIIRVANFGINAFIDNFGRIVVKNGISNSQFLDLYI